MYIFYVSLFLLYIIYCSELRGHIYVSMIMCITMLQFNKVECSSGILHKAFGAYHLYLFSNCSL